MDTQFVGIPQFSRTKTGLLTCRGFNSNGDKLTKSIRRRSSVATIVTKTPDATVVKMVSKKLVPLYSLI